MLSFVYNALPSRVIFGSGTLDRVAAEVDRLAVSRPLVLTTPQQAAAGRALITRIGNPAARLFSEAAMHTPVAITEKALAVMHAAGADGVVALGGGSTTGLGKAIALRTDVPQLVIPTTYAGSEMTPILGETKDGLKTTQRSPKILPETVVYDVDLTIGLPAALSATSGMNAIAHAVEALYAEDRNPIISFMAEESIAAMARALPRIVARPDDGTARADALYGAWLAGACLGSVGMALHHKLCHVLGGSFELPHPETHTVVLPHAAAYNASAAPDAMTRVAAALGASDAARGLRDLAARIGAPTSLRELGMPENGIEKAADIAMANPYWNPEPLRRDAIRDLIARAWAGADPKSSVG